MEEAEMKFLLQKYWEAETSVEEERQLAEYFRQPGIGPEWESVRGLFEWREEEAEVKPGPDFDERMLRRIKEMESEEVDSAAMGRGRTGVAKGRLVSGFSIRFAAAASIILCLGIGLLIPAVSPKPERMEKTAGTASVMPSASVRDTYTDPQQALAAVRQALLIASVRMNEGKHITQRNIDRLHDTWQVATGQKKQL